MAEGELAVYGFRMLASLVVVVALILVLAAVARKVLPALERRRLAGGGVGIEILDMKVLDSRNRLLVVAYEGRRWLIGTSPSGIERVDGWLADDADEANRQLRGRLEEPPAAGGGET